MRNGDKISIPVGSMLDVKLVEYHKEEFDLTITLGNPGFARNHPNSRKVVILVDPANAPGDPRHEFKTTENVELYNAIQDELTFYAASKKKSQHVERTMIIREIVKIPCPYCGNLNEIIKMKCDSCGAPVK